MYSPAPRFSPDTTKRSVTRRSLARRLANEDIPTLPELMWRVVHTLRDSNSSLDEVAEAISLDPGISVRLLRTANSAANGLRRPISDAAHAVVLLGRAYVEAVVLTTVVRNVLPNRPAPGFDAANFWRKATLRAYMGRSLARLLCPEHQALSFTAGLLQDMAIPLLAHHGPEDYGRLLQKSHRRGVDLARLERARYGWDHTALGGELAERWHFPADLTAAIEDHHLALGEVGEASLPTNLVAQLSDRSGNSDVANAAKLIQARLGLDAAEVFDALLDGRREARRLIGAVGH